MALLLCEQLSWSGSGGSGVAIQNRPEDHRVGISSMPIAAKPRDSELRDWVETSLSPYVPDSKARGTPITDSAENSRASWQTS
jgi:hypothetical protein